MKAEKASDAYVKFTNVEKERQKKEEEEKQRQEEEQKAKEDEEQKKKDEEEVRLTFLLSLARTAGPVEVARRACCPTVCVSRRSRILDDRP